MDLIFSKNTMIGGAEKKGYFIHQGDAKLSPDTCSLKFAKCKLKHEVRISKNDLVKFKT